MAAIMNKTAVAPAVAKTGIFASKWAVESALNTITSPSPAAASAPAAVPVVKTGIYASKWATEKPLNTTMTPSSSPAAPLAAKTGGIYESKWAPRDPTTTTAAPPTPAPATSTKGPTSQPAHTRKGGAATKKSAPTTTPAIVSGSDYSWMACSILPAPSTRPGRVIGSRWDPANASPGPSAPVPVEGKELDAATKPASDKSGVHASRWAC
ncbi:hypothetical protein W97_02673 [Coniosporium apollinis CBS 100218]|uniref:Uncharacterized protein n=1 Tax=Coniosporium apollinis (strain CBS 100218) TaxID=1168221 RepID=R7YNE2_CONA1|nr:uncharacterized protein W97_02673 [Coniosporium apollinis CBS 100218]EON63445.1 hypothetical protein W97_02673 [Coniosporium apollinis CBS 100218]